uniref:Uncharacterized protein n=1 Tax=Rhizophora mucronata TaxID=61149 RepID=A0A2P2Q630_RHIMU
MVLHRWTSIEGVSILHLLQASTLIDRTWL